MAGGAALVVIAVLSWMTILEKAAAPPGPAPVKFVNNTATISTSAELMSAVAPANAGRRVHLRAGTYDITHPLIVPDGMTLEGEGVMSFAPQGYAAGFSSAPHTTVRMTANTVGDVITLGNNATLRNLEIRDLEGRSGNIIAVNSRKPRDSVSAVISDVVVFNPNAAPLTSGGPVGRGLMVTTQNLPGTPDPPPHDNSRISVKFTRSVIKSPANGEGFFIFNFAASSRIAFDVSRSSIAGTSQGNGGVSRPDPVHDSEVRITSEKNLYVNELADKCILNVLGLNLTGGSGAPRAMKTVQTSRNRLVVQSVDDRIEGFKTAILATGGRSFYPASLNPPPQGNRIDLQLIGTTLVTPSCPTVRRVVDAPGAAVGTDERTEEVRDLRIVGAEIVNEGADPGEGNTVRLELSGVTGSGTRANRYANADAGYGLLPRSLQGKGNRLEVVGDPATFKRTNRSIDPAPAAEFFSRKQ